MVSVTGSCIDFTSAVLSAGTAQIRCGGSWTKVSSPSSSLTLSTPRCRRAPAHHRGHRRWGSIQLPQHNEGPPGAPDHWPAARGGPAWTRPGLLRCCVLWGSQSIPRPLGGSQGVSSPPPLTQRMLQQTLSIPIGSSRCPPGSRGGRTAIGNSLVTWTPFAFFRFPHSRCPASRAAGNGMSPPCPHQPFLWTWQSPAWVSSSPSCKTFLIVTGHKPHAFFLRIADLVNQRGQDRSCGCRSC